MVSTPSGTPGFGVVPRIRSAGIIPVPRSATVQKPVGEVMDHSDTRVTHGSDTRGDRGHTPIEEEGLTPRACGSQLLRSSSS